MLELDPEEEQALKEILLGWFKGWITSNYHRCHDYILDNTRKQLIIDFGESLKGYLFSIDKQTINDLIDKAIEEITE